MSVIAVSGIPFKFSLKQMVFLLARTINGQFEALNFGDSAGQMKTLYLRLSETMDPVGVVEKINGRLFGHNQFKATIPKTVPDLPLAKKRVFLPKKLQKNMALPPTYAAEKATTIGQKELMTEMQSKYTGLEELDQRTHGKLLEEMALVVQERLKKILSYLDSSDCSKLTREYRKKFPHHGDFVLIQSVLRKLGQLDQNLTEASLKPKQISEVDPTAPFKKVARATHKTADLVIRQVQSHINNLSTKPEKGQDAEEAAARVRVRQELKKMGLYVPEIVRMLVTKNVMSDNPAYPVLRVYGEPRLPVREKFQPILARMRGRSTRSPRLYNLLTVNLPRDQVSNLLAINERVINGCKIIVRPFRLNQKTDPALEGGDDGEAEAEAEAMDEAMEEAMDEADGQDELEA